MTGKRDGTILHGLMQDWPMTVDRFIDHAARWHGDREVAFRTDDGGIGRKAYAEVRADAARLSNALIAQGIVPGDRVASLAMNGVGHLEAWYAIAGIGAVIHTLNPRLFIDQLVYIINHAQDRLLLADGAFAPIVHELLPQCPTVEAVIYLTGKNAHADIAVPQHNLADFRAPFDSNVRWGEFDERTAAGLCYTSGTTGNPKGVLYSHRSNFLHTLISLQPDLFGISERDVILAVVPMYHANAWGMTFSGPAAGAKLVLPGAAMDGASLMELVESEGVTVSAGVPTVWMSFLDHLEKSGQRPSTLRRVFIGGAACPEHVLRRFDAIGIEPVHAWGMTETSPIGSVSRPTKKISELPFEAQIPWRMKQGRAPCGVELKLTDENGEPVPHDGESSGRLAVRGPYVASGYFGLNKEILDQDGFFDTGDIATIDPQGFMRITDRAKDIIKSGGEWISSIDLENAAVLHPSVALAAAIGIPHDKWGERPRLYVQLHPDHEPDAEALQVFLAERLARWWLPDEIRFIDRMPVSGTGKIDKKVLRSASETT
ncbi:MAG: long-chain fatty acid--CoA ligase [Sphingomonadaceae bacterium]